LVFLCVLLHTPFRTTSFWGLLCPEILSRSALFGSLVHFRCNYFGKYYLHFVYACIIS
jgi:hypothetical protein